MIGTGGARARSVRRPPSSPSPVALGPPIDGSSRPRARTRRSATSALFVARRVDRHADRAADRRPARRRLPRRRPTRRPATTSRPLVAGAVPPIDPATLPERQRRSHQPHRDHRRSRRRRSGRDRPVSLFAPLRAQLPASESRGAALLRARRRPATSCPNITVRAGDRAQRRRRRAVPHGARVADRSRTSTTRYDDFISTEVVANSPAGSISQAINLARVRIQGVEAQAETPFVAGGLDVVAERGRSRARAAPCSRARRR